MLESVTPQEIHTVVRRVRNNISGASDDIKTPPLKHISFVISPVLSHTIKEMFLRGKFPDN